jgi:hypothetical protein
MTSRIKFTIIHHWKDEWIQKIGTEMIKLVNFGKVL